MRVFAHLRRRRLQVRASGRVRDAESGPLRVPHYGTAIILTPKCTGSLVVYCTMAYISLHTLQPPPARVFRPDLLSQAPFDLHTVQHILNSLMLCWDTGCQTLARISLPRIRGS